MLAVHQLAKAYGLTPILKNITFSVNSGERVGLIGPNGSGKTTLLRILTGQEHADSGHVNFTPGSLRVGYLAQGFEPDPALTIAQVLQEATSDPDALEAELTHIAQALAHNPDQIELQNAYDDTLGRLSNSDPGQVQALLASFNLDGLDEDASGGHVERRPKDPAITRARLVRRTTTAVAGRTHQPPRH